MNALWKAFRHGDWPFGNTIRPKQRPGVRKSHLGDATVLCLPKNSQEVSLTHFGRALWDLCDGRQTIGEIFLKLRRGESRPEHELVADMTKNFLQLHQFGALELLGMEEVYSEKTRTLDLRDITFYVINCPGDDKKREFIQQQLLEKQLPLKFIKGVQCTPRYVGIALSHLKVLRSANVTVPFAIVEDDCQFTNSFPYQFEVPSITDALYLGVSYFGTKTPGEFSWGSWKATEFSQYNDNYLRVFNMLGRHAIVYLTERFRQSAIEASVKALTNPAGPYPGDIGYALLQTTHLVLTPNDPICYQSEKHNGKHRETKRSLRRITERQKIADNRPRTENVIFHNTDIFKRTNEFSHCQAHVDGMEIVKIQNDSFFLFYDIFVHWSQKKVTAVAPYYHDDIDWKRYDVDYENIKLSFGSYSVSGTYIPYRLDSWEPCIVIDFEHPMLERFLKEKSSIDITIQAGPHEKRFKLSTDTPPAYETAMSVIIRDENRWIPFYLDYYLHCMKVQHVFVYDNFTREKKELFNMLAPYLDQGQVTYIPWHHRWRNNNVPRKQIGQPPQQVHTLNKYGNSTWIGFFDVDEFLRIPGKTVPEFLSQYDPNAIGGLSFGLRWFMYKGHANFEDITNPLLSFFFSIRDPLGRKRQKLFVSPKNVRFMRFHWIQEDQREVQIDDTHIFFHHYYLRKARFDEGKIEPVTVYDDYMLNFSHILNGRDEIQSLISNKKARLQTADDWIAHVTTAFEKAERCESKLSDEVLSLKGMCGRFTRHFYNNICDFENCRYLEIGSWTGASLCSAMFQNHIIAVSIDNWSQFGGPKEKYFENVSNYKGACNLSTLEQDCFNTDKETLGTFNVYLYDGSHSWEDQYNALVQYYDNLEDLAVIIIDDWNWKDTQFGTRKAIQDLHLPIVLEKEILLEEKDLQGMPRHTGKETWWNGIYVMIIDKNLRKQKPPSLYLSQDLQKEKPAIIQNKTDPPINIIVFSKDRACQLEALLRSMEAYFHHPHIAYVFYDASTPEFERGYNRLINKQNKIVWVRQNDFRSDFLSLINNTVRKEYPYLMFLVDDIVFVREFTGKNLLDRFKSDQDILAVSLRMGENITYCYTQDISTTPPTFLPGNRWEWRTASRGYWNYPMSQDGHIFRTTEIIESLSPLSFSNPNSLEAISAAHPIDKPYLMCDRRPYLINLPLNRVHNVYHNRHGSISEEMLNEYFLEGLVIDIQPMAQKTYISCHVEEDILLYNDQREVFLHNKQPTF